MDHTKPEKEECIPIEELHDYFQERGDMRIYNYFQALIRLSAAICLGRNYKCITQLSEVYKIDQVIDCVLSKQIPSTMRANFAKLLIHLHLDRDPLEKLVVPIMTRKWNDIADEIKEVPVGTKIPSKLMMLKKDLNDFISETKGVLKASDREYNQLMLEVLLVLETMIDLGFFANEKELIDITNPLVLLLNGCTDVYEQDANRYKCDNEQNLIIVKIKCKIVDIFSRLLDFQNNSRLTSFLIQFGNLDKKDKETINNYCKIFNRTQSAFTPNKKDMKELNEMSDTRQEITDAVNSWVKSGYADKQLDLQHFATENLEQDLTCILLDLNLYENSDLVSKAFELLTRTYGQKKDLMELASEVQILQDASEIATLNHCETILRHMKKEAEAAEFWLGKEEERHLKRARGFIDNMTSLIGLCIHKENRVLENIDSQQDEAKGNKKETQEQETEKSIEFEVLNLSELKEAWDAEDCVVCDPEEVVDEQNQRLLKNLMGHNIALSIISHNRNNPPNPTGNITAQLKVVEKCYSFLVRFVRQNKDNSNLILKHIELFYDDLDKGVHAIELIKEIFIDNENLLSFDMAPLISRIADAINDIDLESTKKATLISFVPEFMKYKDDFHKPTQNLILTEFTSPERAKLNQLYVGTGGNYDLLFYMEQMKDNYQKFMDDSHQLEEINLPPEMAYTMQYLNLIAAAGMGKNAQCETRAQAIFPMEDLIYNMETAEFCFPLKSSLLLFLEHIYLDTEKEIGEDFLNQVWELIDVLEQDLIKFVKVMQRQKRGVMTVSKKTKTLKDDSEDQGVEVDINNNFAFVTNFGKFSVTDLLTTYVFESIFPTLSQFFALRRQISSAKKEKLRILLKLCYMAVGYKSKPSHEKRISKFVQEVQSNNQLMQICTDNTIPFGSMPVSNADDGGKNKKSAAAQQDLSPAQKVKVFMQISKPDATRKKQVTKEFEELVICIIDIKKRTEQAFNQANTIQPNNFIKSLIQSSDINSSISTLLRTCSLNIIRKIIESENKGDHGKANASEWETEDWYAYKDQIVEQQDMLNKLEVVGLLCRIITKETNRAILEEAMLVAIAVLIGGHSISQKQFQLYIEGDDENAFLIKINEMLYECFELIKKRQQKRIQKQSKLGDLELKIEELDQEESKEEHEEEREKLEDQKKVILEDIVDTKYIQYEDRIGEELTLSRAIDNIKIVLRFIQLLCENHNHDLQISINNQKNSDGKQKMRQVNLVQQIAKMLDQFQKIINDITIDIGHSFIDTLTESIQGPCKENQKALCDAKIMDSSREFISNFGIDLTDVSMRGFVKPEDEDDEENPLVKLDEFVSKIATMLTSLLEGPTDVEILSKMDFSLQIPDLKNRMLNVFGVFLRELEIFPRVPDNMQDHKLSQLSNDSNGFNFLAPVSTSKVDSKLSDNSFEGAIAEAFEIYFLLLYLADGLPHATKDMFKKSSFTPDQFKVVEFLKNNMGKIEVYQNQCLQNVYFPVRPVCNFMTAKARDKVMEEVVRDTQATKVESLMEAVPGLNDEMDQNYKRQSAKLKITPQTLMRLKDFSTLIGAIMSSIQLFTLTRSNHYKDPNVPPIVEKIVNILGIVQGFSSGILIFFYYLNRFDIVTKAGWRIQINQSKYLGKKPLANESRLSVDEMSIEQTHMILICKGPDAIEFKRGKERNFGNKFTKIEYHIFNFYFFMQDKLFVYYVLYFGISVLGFLTEPLFYSFQLLDVLVRFPKLNDVVQSVTSNAEKLIATGLLALVILYIYTTISFFYLQDTIYDYAINAFDSDWVGENMCESMFRCYVTIIDKGLTLGGGIGDYTEAINYHKSPDKYAVKLFHDASFHIVVNVIMLNILAGIVIDTFALLRNEKNEVQDDKKGKCFICNLDREDFDKGSEGGFDRHIAKDHNLWQYVFYIVHLVEKDETEMTGIESYVFDLYKRQDQSWMPRQMALCLQQNKNDQEEGYSLVEMIKEEMNALSAKLDDIYERIQALAIMAQKKQAS